MSNGLPAPPTKQASRSIGAAGEVTNAPLDERGGESPAAPLTNRSIAVSIPSSLPPAGRENKTEFEAHFYFGEAR